MALISSCEVSNFDSILRKLGQLEQRVFKFFSFLRIAFKLLELLAVIDFILELASVSEKVVSKDELKKAVEKLETA